MENRTKSDWIRSRSILFLPLTVAAFIYLLSTADRAVTDYDEGYYAQAAQQMVLRGDYVTPYANGVRYLEKPPLMYWLTATSFRIFGITEFALRLPTALGVILLVWIVSLTAAHAWGNLAGAFSGLVMASAVGTYLFTREVLHDIWLVFFIALAIFAFLRLYLSTERHWPYWFLFYLAFAGAVMCKSLVGIAFPLGIIILFYLLAREHPKWKKFHIVPGTLLFLILTIPWHCLAAIRNPGFLYAFFVNEQFLRFLGKQDPPGQTSVPLLLFWLLLLVWYFPWTMFLPASFESARRPASDSHRTLIRLALIWFVVIMGFFSFSSRLEHYAFPALPALALLTGLALSKPQAGKWLQRAFGGLAVLGILLLSMGIVAGIWFRFSGLPLVSSSADRANVIAATDYSILEEMPSDIMRQLIVPAVITLIVFAVGFTVAFLLERRKHRLPAVLVLAAAMTTMFGMTHWSLQICEDMISTKKFGLVIAREAKSQDRLVVIGDYESANSLNFYQPLRVEIYQGLAYHLIPGMKYPDAPRIILTDQEFETLWHGGEKVFVVVPQIQAALMKLDGKEMLLIGDRVLICNH